MSRGDIVFRRIVSLRGPNIWTYRPAVEAWVDIGAFEDQPSNALPGFVDRLVAWLPGIAAHRCGVGEAGGFLLRLREGTWMAHILEHATLELQTLIGMRTGFGKTRSTSQRGVYKMVVRSRDEQTTRACLETARALLLAAVEDAPFDLAAALAPLRELADAQLLGPSTGCIVDAATERQIPSIRLNDGNLVQLGHGARSRRIWTAETDATSAIAEGIASDKALTKRLLQACGVPVPHGRRIDSAEDAWAAAQDIGLPVVVKPVDANHGRGVFVDLNTEEDIKSAYAHALHHSRAVIVERFLIGNEHRLLVVGGRVIAAARGESAWITGDGRATVAELIARQINADPRRGTTEDHPLNPVEMNEDSEAVLDLARAGFRLDSVPGDGSRVLVQRNGNVAFDCTDDVHPQVVAQVELAARIVGLDVAGIDLVAADISRPLADQGGAIVEVNAGPGLLAHLKPASGEPRPVGRAIVESLFPAGESGRIPIVGIAGTAGMNVVARIVAWLLHLAGKHVGLACGDGLYLDRRRVANDGANWDAAHRVLLNRAVDAAVFENGCRMILGDGLPYDKCQVGVVTGIGAAEGLDDFDIRDADQLYNVVRTQVDVVLPGGAAVLNAEDARVAQMAPLCDGEVIFFGADADGATLAAHRAGGGRAVCVRGGQVILATGATEIPLLAAAALPAAAPLADMLAAVGAAWALGIPADLIRTGIETFNAGHAAAPPRREAPPAGR